jgi:hypothetical protein
MVLYMYLLYGTQFTIHTSRNQPAGSHTTISYYCRPCLVSAHSSPVDMSVPNSAVWTKVEYSVEAHQVAEIIFGDCPWLVCNSCERVLFCITSQQQSTWGEDSGAITCSWDSHMEARSAIKFMFESDRLFSARSSADTLAFWAPLSSEESAPRFSLCDACIATGSRRKTCGWRALNYVMTEEMLVKFLLDRKLVCDICNDPLVKLSKLDHTITQCEVL